MTTMWVDGALGPVTRQWPNASFLTVPGKRGGGMHTINGKHNNQLHPQGVPQTNVACCRLNDFTVCEKRREGFIPSGSRPAGNRTAQPCPSKKSARRSTNKIHCMPPTARRLQPEQRAPGRQSHGVKPCPQKKSAHRSTSKILGMRTNALLLQQEQCAPAQPPTAISNEKNNSKATFQFSPSSRKNAGSARTRGHRLFYSNFVKGVNHDHQKNL
jgi:hypothetical protein